MNARRILKRVGLLLAVAFFAVWAGSLRWSVYHVFGGTFGVRIQNGVVSFLVRDDTIQQDKLDYHWYPGKEGWSDDALVRLRDSFDDCASLTEWVMFGAGFGMPASFKVQVRDAQIEQQLSWEEGNKVFWTAYHCYLPMWMPFLLFAVPTTLMIRRDRRCALVGHCRYCNYDLTGNASGICPECGAANAGLCEG